MPCDAMRCDAPSARFLRMMCSVEKCGEVWRERGGWEGFKLREKARGKAGARDGGVVTSLISLGRYDEEQRARQVMMRECMYEWDGSHSRARARHISVDMKRSKL